MPDHLYLSLKVRGFGPSNMLRHLEEAMRIFPFSRLRPGISSLRVYALEFQEPPLFEEAFSAETDVDTVLALAGEFAHADCAYIVDGWWELWRFEGDWQLTPARVSITCFGPKFDNDEDDHLRIDLGLEADYLPQAEAPDSARRVQSNLRSVLRLVRDIEQSLPIEHRNLWSESGENFAARVEAALAEEAG